MNQASWASLTHLLKYGKMYISLTKLNFFVWFHIVYHRYTLFDGSKLYFHWITETQISPSCETKMITPAETLSYVKLFLAQFLRTIYSKLVQNNCWGQKKGLRKQICLPNKIFHLKLVLGQIWFGQTIFSLIFPDNILPKIFFA